MACVASSRTNSMCLQHHVGLGGDDDAGAVAEAAEQRGGLGEQVLELALRLALDLPGDLAALALVDRADFEHGVDEEAQALLRRLPAGARCAAPRSAPDPRDRP